MEGSGRGRREQDELGRVGEGILKVI